MNPQIFQPVFILAVAERRTQTLEKCFTECLALSLGPSLPLPCSAPGGMGLTPAGCVPGGGWRVGRRGKSKLFLLPFSRCSSHHAGLLWSWLLSGASCLGSGCTISAFGLSSLPVAATFRCCLFQDCLTIPCGFSASSITCVTNALECIPCFKSGVAFLCLVGQKLM